MEMSIASVTERHLAETESQLLTVLERVLPKCAEGGTLIFFNSENLPSEYPEHWLSPESDELLELATRSMELREKLSLPVTHSLGQLFLSACAEYADQNNPHRRGPRKLAMWLLAEIRSGLI
jgi:hypothetical protein